MFQPYSFECFAGGVHVKVSCLANQLVLALVFPGLKHY
jgi:hypothetical protein